MSLGSKVYERVKRSAKITIKAQDRFAKAFHLDAEDFMAKCIQHEMDHLDGILFIDHLSLLKRLRIDKKLAKSS